MKIISKSSNPFRIIKNVSNCVLDNVFARSNRRFVETEFITESTKKKIKTEKHEAQYHSLGAAKYS